MENKQQMDSIPETGSAIHVAPSPHLSDTGLTTQRMMTDVLIALAPVVAMSVYVFQWYAVHQIVICVASCAAAEALFTNMRGKALTLKDFQQQLPA